MIEMKRLYDWRARLAAEMDRQRRDPFAWGKHDCAIGFGAGIVEAITGADLARGYRGKYASPKGAERILRSSGSETLADFVGSLLPEIEPAFARIGDLGVVDADGPGGQGICMFDYDHLVVMTEQGHGHRPRRDAVRAFKVG